MAGLLAWAADVVGGGHGDEEDRFPALVFSPEQERQARELDEKAAFLRREIQDLRQRIPPADIAQSLPHLHAHSLASNAALALQLNAHSATRQQVQLREETLQEENAAYEKAILACHKKIEEKSNEATVLQKKLKELDLAEKNLLTELEKEEATLAVNQSAVSSEGESSTDDDKTQLNQNLVEKVSLEQLEEKKNELSTCEIAVHDLEGRWAAVQRDSLKQPSSVQREKNLEKQLHGLIEQLTVKQTQAEALMGEIKAKEKELERLNVIWRRLEERQSEETAARNRFNNRGGSSSSTFLDGFSVEGGRRHGFFSGGRLEREEKPIILRSLLLLYILTLHLIVFIKISF
ncbi:golgin family A protein [Wolffia australiana]